MNVAILSPLGEKVNIIQELITAARIMPVSQICVFVFEEPSKEIMELNVDEIIVLRNSSCIVDTYLKDLTQHLYKKNFEIILSSSTLIGNELITKIGLELSMSVLKWVSHIQCNEFCWTMTRPVYGFQLEAEFSMKPGLLAMTIVTDAYPKDERIASPQQLNIRLNDEPIRWLTDFYETIDDKMDNLDKFETVIIVGRGIGSKKNVERIEKICLQKHWGLGCTRPVAMNGWLPMNKLVGLSGSNIHSKRVLVLGASGAMPFLEGIKNSELILAVNIDREAAIFRTCDFGVVEDCEKAIEKLEELIVYGVT